MKALLCYTEHRNQPEGIPMKKAVRILFFAAGGALLLNGAHVSLVSNFNLGTILVFALGACFVLFGALYARLWKWLRVTVLCGTALLVLLCAGLSVYGGFDNAGDDTEALVVLGCGVRGDRVSVGLARRLDKALAFYRDHPDVVIVVSGGQGAQEQITEAEAMRRYLAAHGVPNEKIIKEEQATSTLENLQFSDEILRERFPEGYHAALVTSRFHVFRAERIAMRYRLFYTHLGAPSKWYAVPMNNLRELVAIAHELLRGSIRF